MDDRVKQLKQMILDKRFEPLRRPFPEDREAAICDENTPLIERTTLRFCSMLEAETPVVFDNERIAYVRTVKNLPSHIKEDEMRSLGLVWAPGNVCPDYATTIKAGLAARRKQCTDRLGIAERDGNSEQVQYLSCVIKSIDAVTDLARRYREEAVRVGNTAVADTLSRVPEQGAETLVEALQFFRILHFALWCEGVPHNGIGRFDQYMYPYWKQDIENGTLTEDEAFSLLEEFFLTFNRDNSLYPGVQRGDNGQSMMLGGVDKDGNYAFNDLSSACLKASREILMIDPKINLRVDKNTPPEVFYEGTLLTKAGLGFPQYSNDDVVVEGLTKLGYSLEDARDYTVAACWEFIIPRYGMEIPNIDAFRYTSAVENCVERLDSYSDFEALIEDVKHEMKLQCDRLVKSVEDFKLTPSPYLSLFMDDCVENARDISQGARYNNYGFHGVGLAEAVDALESIRLHLFEKKDVTAEQMMKAVESDFENDAELLNLCRYNTPKFGDGEGQTTELACRLTSHFADILSGYKNNRGGIFRAGTGSAMFYIWYGDESKATPGGHRKGEALGANYSPELFVQNKGPLSVMRAFCAPDLKRVINGGPLTMEFHDSVFRHREDIEKVAALVRAFVQMGGHQMQLNSVNRDVLLDAREHPEQYQNLIVRVWGWSAYFVQLDREYQDHVIARQEYRL